MRTPSLARLRAALAPRGNLDAVTTRRVGGWALCRGRVDVEVWIDNRCVGRCRPSIGRDDVAAAFPGCAEAGTCGFALDLPNDAIGEDFIGHLHVIARPNQPWRPSAKLASIRVAGASVLRSMAQPPDSHILGPFPKGVIDAIAARWPEDCTNLLSSDGQRRFVARLIDVMATTELNALPVFSDYARYLSVTLAHCRFVERHFPPTNTRSNASSPDFHSKPNSVAELFAIIHQIYVLKSWGVEGDFAEFGCFKGYSSAMLSFACQQLGVRMHVFDSFEGLPPSGHSGYEAGQYAGSLHEVRDHVSRFGALEVVEFHKGFFVDTFREWRPPKLMCLWMDVDLELSSRDLMVVADRLDPRASLFSHECTAGTFLNGSIANDPRPDNPVPPMLMRHEELGRPLTGRYVAGYTGAFWPLDGGIPVIDNVVLMQIARSIS